MGATSFMSWVFADVGVDPNRMLSATDGEFYPTGGGKRQHLLNGNPGCAPPPRIPARRRKSKLHTVLAPSAIDENALQVTLARSLSPNITHSH